MCRCICVLDKAGPLYASSTCLAPTQLRWSCHLARTYLYNILQGCKGLCAQRMLIGMRIGVYPRCCRATVISQQGAVELHSCCC